MKSCIICGEPLRSCQERAYCLGCRPIADQWHKAQREWQARADAALAAKPAQPGPRPERVRA